MASSSVLGLPKRIDLPYFAYGLLQPHEIAHAQIEPFLEDEPAQDEVQGFLHARDGLPLLESAKIPKQVYVYLLRFADEHTEEVYTKIADFEPAKHYRWETVEVLRSGEPANTLVGKKIQKGTIMIEEGVWRGRQNPLLTSGLYVV